MLLAALQAVAVVADARLGQLADMITALKEQEGVTVAELLEFKEGIGQVTEVLNEIVAKQDLLLRD